LHIAHHQDLIQEWQAHPLQQFATAPDHHLFTLQPGLPEGLEEIQAAHGGSAPRR